MTSGHLRGSFLSEHDPRIQAARERPPRACEICGLQSAPTLYRKNGLDVVRCRNCKLVFVAQLFADDELAGFYGDEYYTGAVYDDYGGREELRRRRFREHLTWLRQLGAPGSRLLDVGAAYGFFVSEALGAGFRAEGVEISAAAVAQARANGLPVRLGTLASLEIPAESFDIVTLWDTIEHLRRPRATLAEINRVLTPGGILALTTANVRSLSSFVFRQKWSLIAPPWHLFYFDPQTVKRLAHTVGLTDVAVDAFSPLLYDVHWSGDRLVDRFATKAFTNRFACKLAQQTRLGSLMLVTARKPRSASA